MIIDQLEENLTLENYAEHMEEINRLARSRDASCRIRLADPLCGFPNPHAKTTLLALTEDASYLVQTSAIDSLSAFPGDDTLAAMRLCASRHPLVRGYAFCWATRNVQTCETGCLPYGKPIHLRKSACLRAWSIWGMKRRRPG